MCSDSISSRRENLRLGDQGASSGGLGAQRGSFAANQAQNIGFRLPIRIIHPHVQQKAIQLGFRQGIGSFLLDRILGRHNHKQLGQGKVWRPAHLTFCHGFQESRLHLGRCAIDFVGQDQVVEDRAGLKIKLPSARR